MWMLVLVGVLVGVLVDAGGAFLKSPSSSLAQQPAGAEMPQAKQMEERGDTAPAISRQAA